VFSQFVTPAQDRELCRDRFGVERGQIHFSKIDGFNLVLRVFFAMPDRRACATW